MGVVVKEELCEKVMKIRLVSDRMKAVVFVFEKSVLRMISGYALQCGRNLVEK